MKLNRATLYRQQGYSNRLERPEEYGEDQMYDSGVYGYDYGFENGDYFLDLDSVDGLKGDPGPPVSITAIIIIIIFNSWCVFVCASQSVVFKTFPRQAGAKFCMNNEPNDKT